MSIFKETALKGKVALITGGHTGICLSITKFFLQHGAKVVIIGRRAQLLQDVSNDLNTQGFDTLPVACDVRDYNACKLAVEKTVEHYGRLDILLNGAAGNFLCAADDLSTNAFKTVIEIDLIGTFNMSKAAHSYLKENKGVIINISANVNELLWYQAHASSAKAGINTLTNNLAIEWAPEVRVVGIAPGMIGDTEGFRRLGGQLYTVDKLSALVPLNRLGTSQDIAEAALFLATASWITGTTISVDGGSRIMRPPVIDRHTYDTFISRSKKASL